MSSALPVLVTPICIEDKCYIDGGITSNYPLKYCIDSGKNIEEILGFKNKYDDYNKNHINSSSSLLDFIMNFLFKIILSISSSNKLQIPITFEVVSNTDFLSISTLKTALYSIEVREKLYTNGIEIAKTFLSNLENAI
jgi:predicted patatin/cPLA2 family phospholipase